MDAGVPLHGLLHGSAADEQIVAGSMSSKVECILALKDNTGLGQNISNNAAITPLTRKLELEESEGPINSELSCELHAQSSRAVMDAGVPLHGLLHGSAADEQIVTGSVSSKVECILALKDNTGLGQNISNNATITPLTRKLELEESDGPINSELSCELHAQSSLAVMDAGVPLHSFLHGSAADEQIVATYFESILLDWTSNKNYQLPNIINGLNLYEEECFENLAAYAVRGVACFGFQLSRLQSGNVNRKMACNKDVWVQAAAYLTKSGVCQVKVFKYKKDKEYKKERRMLEVTLKDKSSDFAICKVTSPEWKEQEILVQKDEMGSVSSKVECILALKDNTGLGQNISNNAAITPLTRKLELEESDGPINSGQKVHDAFQLKWGSYTDVPAAKISENAPTQSLLRVVNGILDESIERKRGEIPHQNSIIKTREDKYRSKSKAFEKWVNGTNEENEVEKLKLNEKRKLGEQDMVHLLREKENAENTIASLQQEIQILSRMHEEYRERMETEARQMAVRLKETEFLLMQSKKKIEEIESASVRLKETEFLLMQSKKKIEEIESASQLKSQLWSRKANIFQNFMDTQKVSIKDIRISSQSIKQEMFDLQLEWRDEISHIGHDLKGLVGAADNYHKVFAENQKLFNEVQELKGNIRVYCRVRPFLSGQDGKPITIDYIGENGEICVINPFKQGKDGCRMFKFNKVFHTHASQAEVFFDIQPLIRSVLDGFNVCIFAYGQSGSGKTYTMSGPGTSKEDWGVNYRALNDLFDISLSRRNAFSYEVVVQMVEIYNEQVRDLLSNDGQKRLGICSTSRPNGLVVPDASLRPVKSMLDVLELMRIGQTNRAVGSTALNERSSRSHSILTVHVRGVNLKNGSTSRGCLHLIDLAGSERPGRSQAIGDRLKEAQYINKSLSALGDVIFALAQKNAHVPYRNSKLTQILQSSLGGQAKTLMFVQINPDTESYSETISTLKFAERVSGVELGAARSNKEGKDIKELLEQVTYLKDTISRKDMEIEQLLKDKAKSPSSSTDRNDNSQQIRRLSGAARSGEVECDDNKSDDGCLVAGTEYSVGGASEAAAERMQKAPSRLARLFLTKNGQPANSRPKPWESAPKPPVRTKIYGKPGDRRRICSETPQEAVE